MEGTSLGSCSASAREGGLLLQESLVLHVAVISRAISLLPCMAAFVVYAESGRGLKIGSSKGLGGLLVKERELKKRRKLLHQNLVKRCIHKFCNSPSFLGSSKLRAIRSHALFSWVQEEAENW